MKRLLPIFSIGLCAISTSCTSYKEDKDLTALLRCCGIACRYSDSQYRTRITELLEQRPDLVNGYDDIEIYCTPLQIAAAYGDTDVVKELLSKGAKADNTVKSQYSPLMLAAWHGHTQVVKQLLEAGADPKQTLASGRHGKDQPSLNYHPEWPLENKASKGMTALHFACGKGHAEIARILCKAGANLNEAVKVGNDIHTPLTLAIMAQSEQTVRALLQAGASPNPVNKKALHPLNIAIVHKNEKICELLLQNGAATNSADFTSPVLLAVFINNSALTRLLLKYGANVNTVTKQGFNPLFIAKIMGHGKEMEQLLLRHGANIESMTFTGTHLHAAASRGLTDIVKTILERGISPDDTAEDATDTPLHQAAQYGHTEIVRLLVAAGADTESKNEKEMTPLCLAAIHNQAEAAATLVKAGADTTYSCTYYNHTPLMMAASRNHLETVQAMLNSGDNAATLTKHTNMGPGNNNYQNAISAALYQLPFLGEYRNSAAYRKRFNKMIQLLIDSGAAVQLPVEDANNYYYMRYQPLEMVLADEEYIDIVRMLIDAGAVKGHEAYYRHKTTHSGDFSIGDPHVKKIIIQATSKQP